MVNAMDDGHSRAPSFLDLPRELRDHVYDMLAAAETSLTVFGPMSPVTSTLPPVYRLSKCSLFATSRQTYTEYLHAICRAPSAKIKACVFDVDFNTLIRFVKTLEPNHTKGISAKHKLIVSLTFRTSDELNAIDIAKWVLCTTVTGIHASYVINRSASALAVPAQLQIDRLFVPGGYVHEEKRKLHRAVEAWMRESVRNEDFPRYWGEDPEDWQSRKYTSFANRLRCEPRLCMQAVQDLREKGLMW